MPEKGEQQRGFPADPGDALLGGCQYLGDRVAGKVGQLHSLQVGPQPLDRVQVVGVGGQILHWSQ